MHGLVPLVQIEKRVHGGVLLLVKLQSEMLI